MRKVVYTAIFGDYDNLYEPEKMSEGWEYVCITDNHKLKKGSWNVIYVADIMNNPIRMARGVKILLHDLLEFDVSLWVDGSIEIMCDVGKWASERQGNLVVMKHPARDNIKSELEACIALKKDNEKVMTEQVEKYYRDNYKDEYLIQSTIILRRGNLVDSMKYWFNQIIEHSIRDQLSFGYSMWKTNQKYNVIDWDSKNFKWHKKHKQR